MLRRLATCSLLLMVCAGFFSVSQASEIARQSFSVRFSSQALKAEDRWLAAGSGGTMTFQLVTMGDLDVTRDLGEPCLPVKVMQLYVPRGKEVRQVIVESCRTSVIPGNYLVLPGQREIPMSWITAPEAVPPDEAVYTSSAPYPSSPVILASTGAMAGRKIATLKVFPLQYVPSEGQLVLNEDISFRVELVDCASEPVVPRETAAVAGLRNSIVAGMVENGGDLAADFPETGTLSGPAAVEYLIICHQNHVGAYTPLCDWKTRKGVPAAIRTWQDIAATYSGRDGAEKFRNCIKDYYLNHGTMWVAICGSGAKAAAYLRGCYCDVEGTLDAKIPCDLYFCDMDGDWNLDNDSYWGEVGDDADLYPDVYVGRLTGNTAAQCSTIVRKVLTYEGALSLPTDYERNMLFMGEWLDGDTDAAINKNMIDNESVPARFDPILKLYESSGNENHAAAMNALNAGKGIVNHDGHGNASLISIGPDVLSSDDMAALTNAPRYTVFYTLACDPGAFDNPMGCLARSFAEAPGGGGFFVGNSRYGWYWPGASGYGTGDVFDREFFKSIFVRGLTNLGAIHADAKIQRIPYSGYEETDRWTQFSLNLFGDPETPVWTDTPKTVAVSYPAETETGARSFVVSASSGGSPLAQARVCLWKGNDVYLVSNTVSGGMATFQIAPADTGTMLVTVTKNGYQPYLGSSHVVDNSSGVAGSSLARSLGLAVAPNPAMGPATISLSLPQVASGAAQPKASLALYDASGRLVVELPASATAAQSRVDWNGRGADGAAVTPGIYFLKASCGGSTATTKLVVLK
jgi:hypothetical protein